MKKGEEGQKKCTFYRNHGTCVLKLMDQIAKESQRGSEGKKIISRSKGKKQRVEIK